MHRSAHRKKLPLLSYNKYIFICFTAWVDSSGFRITYTPTLRTYDVGTVAVGIVDGIVVPPRPDEFRVTSFCYSSCTNQVFILLLDLH